MPRPGWCLWLVRNLRNSAILPNCGRVRRWRLTCAPTPSRRAFRLCPIAAKATVHRILLAEELQPHKVRYYLERRDPEFKEKMRTVVTVYQEVSLYLDAMERDQGGHECRSPIR